MKALRFHGPGDLRLAEVAQPQLRRGEVLVAVEACGVCGSDLHFLDGTARTDHTPITLGHEIAGRVAAEGSPNWSEGTPVVVRAGAQCSDCPRCRQGRPNLCLNLRVVGIDEDGGLAEFVAVPERTLTERPAGLDPAIAALAVDAGATALHAVTRRAGVHRGDAVLIIGVGGLGTFGVQIAAMLGAAPVIAADVDPLALERASALGADETVLVEPGVSLGRRVKLLTDGGVDAAVEFVGRASTVDAAEKSLRSGGIAVAAGVGTELLTTIPPVLWSNNEYSLVGSYGSLPGDAETVLRALDEGTITPPPITRTPLESATEQIMAMAAGSEGSRGRLVVNP
jgi:propanol-preferring alcohol dehydrogenase